MKFKFRLAGLTSWYFLIGLLAFPLMDLSFACRANADNKGVLLSPTRIVFEGRTRSATVQLVNPYDQECDYRISLISMRMDETGKRWETESLNEEERFAQSLIRFSPRRATVGPKQWQTVRLMVRKPSDLPDGEYRVHLKAAPVPDSGQTDTPAGPQKSQGVSVKINYVFNVTIPIFIRHGEGYAGVDIPEPPVFRKDKKGNYLLETKAYRTGNFSVFSDVAAFGISESGAREKLGEVKGISIYCPNRMRTVNIPVSGIHSDTLLPEIIDIEFKNKENKNALLGSGRFKVDF